MRRILVVEDEALVAMDICSLLEDEGLQVVGPAAALSKAVKLANDEALDGAVLDVNIIGGRVDAVAEILARRRVPFVFVTGYGRDHLPKNFRQEPVINKPFKPGQLLSEVRRFK